MVPLPTIIQGGMGVGVSAWPLARAVSKTGQLGVVSGTGIDAVLARRLQKGDPDGDLRRALAAFPFPHVAQRILDRYFREEEKRPEAAFKAKPIPSIKPGRFLTELTVAANFVEVFLAKEGHSGLVGINLLEKIQVQTLPSLYGAMLAGVDVVLMGAGIPRAIPGVLDQLAQNLPVELSLDVAGALPEDRFVTKFQPALFGPDLPQITRPRFLAIVASATLAQALLRRSDGQIDGFVVEGFSAGGHNAPPRGELKIDGKGEPIYSDADVADLAKFRQFELPFWLAGSYGSPERLAQARSEGAQGVQVGTLFALSRESGISPEIRRAAIEAVRSGDASVFTDPFASPTGFPFKVMDLPGTLSKTDLYQSRCRICDMGYLRQLYRKDDGTVGYRCPAEPEIDYVLKGGSVAETTGRKCLCNGLMATIGLGQVRDGIAEPPLVTIGDDVVHLARFLGEGRTEFGASEVVEFLMSGIAVSS